IADNPKVCKYIDLPLQHISTNVLDSMRRNITREKTIELVKKIRASVPEIAFRTTFITGFPTETEDDFEELYQFVKESRFDRVGVFTYSHEEDTPAFQLNDVVPEAIKQERMEKLMTLQQDISLEINESKIGRVERVIIDKIEGEYYVGRTQYDSPEVDNEVLIPAGIEMEPGKFYNVEITAAAHFDLYAKVI
ncbi:MAG TPA: radical SAM protein, partial [Bacteroidales bacterium]|nr:radical SAM protein [Bacteroidales bacterium]